MAEQRQERHRPFWLLGVAAWLALTVICLLTHLGSLESDLANRSQQALATAGLTDRVTDGRIDFTGEIATLRGSVAEDSVRERIGAVVAEVRGVRQVDNLIEVIPVAAAPEPVEPAEPTPPVLALPRLEAVADGGIVTLSGEVPSQTTADGWVAVAESIYGSGNVVNRLTVTDEVGVEAWLDRSSSLDNLQMVTDGSISIGDGRVTVTGTVADEATRNTILSNLASGLPGLAVDDRLVVAPRPADEIASLDLSGINFETASSTITADSIPTLEEAIRTLEAFPAVEVEVGGHTDSDGTAAVNQALSLARAEAVVAYLIEHGISPDRLTAVGYGETQPIADNATPEGKAMNRRIEFVITEGA